MQTWLVTGGAGFIGCNFVRLALAKSDARIVVFDKLTYAGNLASLADVASDRRFVFVQGDIADRESVAAVFREHRPTASLEHDVLQAQAQVVEQVVGVGDASGGKSDLGPAEDVEVAVLDAANF